MPVGIPVTPFTLRLTRSMIRSHVFFITDFMSCRLLLSGDLSKTSSTSFCTPMITSNTSCVRSPTSLIRLYSPASILRRRYSSYNTCTWLSTKTRFATPPATIVTPYGPPAFSRQPIVLSSCVTSSKSASMPLAISDRSATNITRIDSE